MMRKLLSGAPFKKKGAPVLYQKLSYIFANLQHLNTMALYDTYAD